MLFLLAAARSEKVINIEYSERYDLTKQSEVVLQNFLPLEKIFSATVLEEVDDGQLARSQHCHHRQEALQLNQKLAGFDSVMAQRLNTKKVFLSLQELDQYPEIINTVLLGQRLLLLSSKGTLMLKNHYTDSNYSLTANMSVTGDSLWKGHFVTLGQEQVGYIYGEGLVVVKLADLGCTYYKHTMPFFQYASLLKCGHFVAVSQDSVELLALDLQKGALELVDSLKLEEGKFVDVGSNGMSNKFYLLDQALGIRQYESVLDPSSKKYSIKPSELVIKLRSCQNLYMITEEYLIANCVNAKLLQEVNQLRLVNNTWKVTSTETGIRSAMRLYADEDYIIATGALTNYVIRSSFKVDYPEPTKLVHVRSVHGVLQIFRLPVSGKNKFLFINKYAEVDSVDLVEATPIVVCSGDKMEIGRTYSMVLQVQGTCTDSKDICRYHQKVFLYKGKQLLLPKFLVYAIAVFLGIVVLLSVVCFLLNYGQLRAEERKYQQLIEINEGQEGRTEAEQQPQKQNQTPIE